MEPDPGRRANAGERPSPPRRDEPRESPILRFSPTAWAKLLYLRDLGDTEVGGFGITAADNPLYIEDVELVRQACTAISVAFDDQAVAEFFDKQVDLGRRPEQFARHWLHTHPGNSPQPSGTDEDTFARVFGRTDWAVMFILARGGQSYARLRFNVGPGGEMTIPVSVDFSRPFPASNHGAWQEEYAANVTREELWIQDQQASGATAGEEADRRVPLGADAFQLEDDHWWNSLFERDERDMAFDTLDAEVLYGDALEGRMQHGNHA